MKILVYTDNHFCPYSSIIRSRGEKYSSRIENQIDTMNWIYEQSIKFNVDMEVCLGDFFDKNTLDAESITAINDIKWSNAKKLFIVGNHEISTSDAALNSLNVLKQKGFTVISDPQMISMNDTQIYFFPYDNTLEKISDFIIHDKNTIVFSHNDIKGINYGGFETKSGIDINDIKNNCDLFINGHLHNYGKFDNLINLGNVTGQNFSEDAEKYKHYIMILDTDTLNYELIENPYAYKFYKLDFTIKEHDDIDYINGLNLGKNAVVSFRLYKNNSYECIRTRFDKNYQSKYNFPKNCLVVESRCIIVPQENVDKEILVEELHIDHLQQFREYILNHLGNNEYVIEELDEVCK